MKKNKFFNSGLCLPFSEKRYVCFLVNILTALLIIFIPNLVRKCQIMCSRTWVEEAVFLKFFCTVSKENRFLLVTTPCQGKSSSKYFLCCYFCKQKLSHRLGTWDIFCRRFSIICISMARGPNIFLWFCKFQFYIYILINIQGCVVLFAQNILF